MESIIAVIAVVVSIAIYFAGKKQGERQERDRRTHELAAEQGQRLHELASKAADEYVNMARSRFDNGPHALGSLALHLLESDSLIRESIREMHLRAGHDPWFGTGTFVEDVDLVEFFRYAHESKIDFAHVTVEEIAQRVRATGGKRNKNAT